MTRGFFVTGTDTGVGKTVVASALLRAYVGAGLRAVGMKPVAAGCTLSNGRWINDDVESLRSASNVEAPDSEINPYVFRDPIAPHLAAHAEGVRIDLPTLVARYRALAARSDVVIVEGAGGFLVPLNGDESFADLAAALALPVVLVVGMRLGCINHALLTCEAIERRGLEIAGWVANRVTPSMDACDENVATLRSRLGAPLLAEIPHLADPDVELAAPRLF